MGDAEVPGWAGATVNLDRERQRARGRWGRVGWRPWDELVRRETDGPQHFPLEERMLQGAGLSDRQSAGPCGAAGLEGAAPGLQPPGGQVDARVGLAEELGCGALGRVPDPSEPPGQDHTTSEQ